MKRKHKESLTSIAILSPSIITLAIFVYGFISRSVQISMLDWDTFANFMRKAKDYVGLENYISLFTESRFQTDLWNTLYFTLFFIIGCLAIGILLSLILNNKPRGGYFFQNLYLFPMAISFVVTGTVWSWIFAPGTLPNNPQGINLLFHKLGLDNLMWGWYTSTDSLGHFNLALIPVIIAAVWQLSGYTMAMYLAGLRGIPNDIIEAAKVDGASEWKIFWKVKMPLLTPITLSALIILGHISLKIFDLVFAMTGSGPNFVTDVPAIYMFELTFRSNRYALGSAIAIIMLLFVAVVIVPYLFTSMRGEKR